MNTIHEFPKAQELKTMIRGHIEDVSVKVLAIIGQGVRSLQWSGQVTFEDLCYEEGSMQALIVSRLNEKDIRSAVTRVQDHLDCFGYDYEFDVLKLEEKPFFRINYRVVLGEGSENGSEFSAADDDIQEDPYSLFDLTIEADDA